MCLLISTLDYLPLMLKDQTSHSPSQLISATPDALESETPHTRASVSTKCPYCRRPYQQAAACKKHIETTHHDILLSLFAIVYTTLPGLKAFTLDEKSDQGDSD